MEDAAINWFRSASIFPQATPNWSNSPSGGRAAATPGRLWSLVAYPMMDQSPQSPEARRKRLAAMRAAFGREVADRLKPGSAPFEVLKRVAVGVYNDGFIHAGNLAFLALLALFPFFILAAAVASLFGNAGLSKRSRPCSASFRPMSPPPCARPWRRC
jgi:hypothetical protein